MAIETFMSNSVLPPKYDAMRDSKVWEAQRRGHITASSFHDVYALRDTTSTKSLCKRLMPKSLTYYCSKVGN